MQRLSTHAWSALVIFIVSLALTGCGEDANDHAHGDQHASGSSEHAPDASNQSQSLVSGFPDFSRLVKKVSPAVVNISALPSKNSQSSENDDSQSDGEFRNWLRRHFGGGSSSGQLDMPLLPHDDEHVSLGSGFIISSDGYILTSRHVIADSDRIVVKLTDRRHLVAKVVGTDPGSDVAVLKVKADHLPTVQIGDSAMLDVGAWVLAIGSPFGFETSVTAGIVSAKSRSLANDQYVPFLQTDVAINPGNSGGPLFNLAGQVVGVNSQIYSQTGGYQGVSFAIPIDTAMRVARQLRDTGHVDRGWLGVQLQDIDRRLARSFELPWPEGALVTQVFKGSPAAKADIHIGDVILEFNGHPVDSASDLPPLVGALAPGDKVRFKMLRDGKKHTDQIQIGTLPARYQSSDNTEEESSQDDHSDQQSFGLSVQSLTHEQEKKLGLDHGGVRVTEVKPGPAAEAGLKAGDVILSVGSVAVHDQQSLFKALRHADGSVAVLVMRHGVRRYLPIQTG